MQHFNNYTIIKQIGEGGMATVYLAFHNSLKHQVAIKVLNKEFVFNTNIRSRFIEEARKMVRMNHPNVMKVSDLIDEENSVAIVMEYVEGLTLKDILEQKKLNDTEIEYYLKQMLDALGYIHAQSLIHRDIKPSNFILSKDGNLKLTDFGISKALETGTSEHTQTSTAMSLGTPMYMSPEQVRSTKDVTHLTDIYSVGVVLWEMISGKKPYDGNTLSSFDLQLKIVQEDLPLTKTFWDKVVQKATKKDETKRFQSAKEFLLALDDKSVSDSEIDLAIPKQKRKKEAFRQAQEAEEQEKQKRIAYINFKTISIAIGLLLFVGILIFNLSKDSTADRSLAAITDNAKPEIIVPIETSEEPVLEKEKPITNEQKELPKEKQKEVVKVTPIVSSSKLKIGQKHQGGIIFYLDNSGEHGKVCTERDLGEFDWYSAIYECQNLNLNGYSDWYLPSLNDLMLQYNLTITKNGFDFYWSSEEDSNSKDDVGALTFQFHGHYSSAQFKVNTSHVRAVRDF